MDLALPSKAVIAVVVASLLWPTAAFAQILARRDGRGERLPSLGPPHLVLPPLVRFTGTLHPVDEKSGGDIHTLRVRVQNKELLFRLDKVETLTGPPTDWMILSEIFPPELHFTGLEDFMRTLQVSESEGEPVAVEGRLYISDRMFAVTAAEAVAEKPT